MPTASGLVRLYGRIAMQFHDGRKAYHVKNGVLEVPPGEMVTRAVRAGFRFQPPADMRIDEGPDPVKGDPTEHAPAVQTSPLPADAPQAQLDAKMSAREDDRAKALREGATLEAALERAKAAGIEPQAAPAAVAAPAAPAPAKPAASPSPKGTDERIPSSPPTRARRHRRA